MSSLAGGPAKTNFIERDVATFHFTSFQLKFCPPGCLNFKFLLRFKRAQASFFWREESLKIFRSRCIQVLNGLVSSLIRKNQFSLMVIEAIGSTVVERVIMFRIIPFFHPSVKDITLLELRIFTNF